MSSPPFLVHGLDGGEVAADWPPLTAAEVARALALYPALGPLQEILWRSPRPLSAAALVRTERGPVFLKRHARRVRSNADLLEEHRFIAHLRAQGMPIPAPLANAAGRTASTLGEWTWELHETAPGLDLYRERMSWVPPDSTAHARSAGAMLARLRRAAAGYDAPQRHTHFLVARSEILRAADPVAALARQLPMRPALQDHLRAHDWQRELGEAIAPWHARVQPALAAQPPLWTHGDWHVSNLCWSGASAQAGVVAMLDFGLAARNFALFDLATAIERNAIAWLEPDPAARARPALARALIEGYASTHPFGDGERTLLAELLPIVHVDFALSEIEYFAGILHAPAQAEIAWRDFLLGHAAWFRSAPGEAFLAALREPA